MLMGDQEVPERGVRDWLDVIAPVKKKGAVREAAGGMFLLAVVSIGASVWMLITQPFWELSWRLPIPAGILGILVIVTGVWFALLGVNVLRRTRKDSR
jgi:hypothetical protein